MSHNLKTPLNGLLLFVYHLKIHLKKSKYYNKLLEVEKNAYLLLSMINDILDYSSLS